MKHTLDMTVSLDVAREEWDALPDGPKKNAYWQRYCQIRHGKVDPENPVPHTDPASPTPPAKQKPATDRLDMIRNLATKGESERPRSKVSSKQSAVSSPKPIARNPRQDIGRAPAIDPTHYPAIHARILQAARELGYGDLQRGGANKIHGASCAFQRNANIPSSQTFNDTVTTGCKIWPKVIDQIATGIGIMKLWLLSGEDAMLTDNPVRFTPRPTVEQRRKQIIADADPELAKKYPRRKIEPTIEQQAADGWTPSTIAAAAFPGKLPPTTGLIFTPRSAHASNGHATETFSLVGPHAYTSAFAA